MIFHLQLHIFSGTGRSAGDTDLRAARFPDLHARILAMGRYPVPGVRVCRGNLDRCVRVHPHCPVRRSVLCHRKSTPKATGNTLRLRIELLNLQVSCGLSSPIFFFTDTSIDSDRCVSHLGTCHHLCYPIGSDFGSGSCAAAQQNNRILLTIWSPHERVQLFQVSFVVKFCLANSGSLMMLNGFRS